MNRRTFLKALGAVFVAAKSGALELLTPAPPISLGLNRITYRGVPIRVGRDVPMNTVWFIGPPSVWKAYNEMLEPDRRYRTR